jgi:hypothetical protein
MNRRDSDVIMSKGSRKPAKRQPQELTMNNLERMYGKPSVARRKTTKANNKTKKNTESPLPDRLQAAWDGSASVAFTPENWKPDVFDNAQSEFEENKDTNVNVRADAAAIRKELKETLALGLAALESGMRLLFGLSATVLLHREAQAYIADLIENRVNIAKTLVKSAFDQAKKPLVVARILLNTSCNYLGLPGHLLREFMTFVVDPVMRLWWQKQSRRKQETFIDEAESCPAASTEERAEIGKVQSFFLARLFAKFIAWFVDAKFDIGLDEGAIVREFFEKGTQRGQKIAIAKAIFMGTEADLRPLLGILDILDDHSIVKIFRAVRRQLQPLVPSRKTRPLSSNIVGNLNANRKGSNSINDSDNYGAFSVL